MLRAELAPAVRTLSSASTRTNPAWLNRFDNLYGMLCAVTPNGSVAGTGDLGVEPDVYSRSWATT